MLKYVTATLAVLLIASVIGNKILFDKYQNQYEAFVTEKQSKEQLAVSLETQNKTIEQMKLDTELFKKNYEQELRKKIKSETKYIQQTIVKDCNDILDIIEKEL